MTTSTRLLQLCAAFLLIGSALVHAQTSTQPSTVPAPGDAKAIHTTLQEIGDSLTRMDFDTLATLFTDDADFINVVGMHWRGKPQIVQAHRVIFTTRYHGFPQHILDEQVDMITPDVALAVTTVKMDDYTAQDGRRMLNNVSRLSWVLVRHDGKWLVRSGHNTTVDHEAAKHDPVLSHNTAAPRNVPGPVAR